MPKAKSSTKASKENTSKTEKAIAAAKQADSEKPKRPPSLYQQFMKRELKPYKERHPEISHKDAFGAVRRSASPPRAVFYLVHMSRCAMPHINNLIYISLERVLMYLHGAFDFQISRWRNCGRNRARIQTKAKHPNQKRRRRQK